VLTRTSPPTGVADSICRRSSCATKPGTDADRRSFRRRRDWFARAVNRREINFSQESWDMSVCSVKSKEVVKETQDNAGGSTA